MRPIAWPSFFAAVFHERNTFTCLSYFEWHFLVSRPGYLKHFTEEHTLGLFTVEQTKAAFAAAGMSVEHDPEGIFGRGLY